VTGGLSFVNVRQHVDVVGPEMEHAMARAPTPTAVAGVRIVSDDWTQDRVRLLVGFLRG
jgi:hypothetical protein